jgi:hypothetical protein
MIGIGAGISWTDGAMTGTDADISETIRFWSSMRLMNSQSDGDIVSAQKSIVSSNMTSILILTLPYIPIVECGFKCAYTLVSNTRLYIGLCMHEGNRLSFF